MFLLLPTIYELSTLIYSRGDGIRQARQKATLRLLWLRCK